MMTRRFFIASLLTASLAISGLIAGCGGGSSDTAGAKPGGGSSGDTIRIGSLNSMNGPNKVFGESTNNGMLMAAEEKNKAGGLLGKQIEIRVGDTESDPKKASTAVLSLINNDKVVAVIGEVASACSIAAAPACQNAKIPMLSPSSTNPKVTQLGNYIFRSCFIDDFQGVIMAKFAAEDLKCKRAAILTDTKNDYSTGLREVILKEFPKYGGEIVAKETYQADDTTFKTQLSNIKAQNPDIVFLPGYYGQVVMIAKEARELGLNCPFIGGDGWDADTLLKDGGKAVEGYFFTNHYDAHDPDPKVVEFVKKYQDKYGKIPDGQAVTGYDAANIMFAAIEKAKSTDGKAIRDALAETKDFPAVTGSITIGPDRNAVKPAVVIEIKNNAYQVRKRVNP